MNIEDFTYLWDEGIVKAARQLDLELPEDSNRYVNLDLSESNKKRLYDEYEDNRTEIRRNFFDGGENASNRIDAHKICACITGALLKVHLFELQDTQDDIPEDVVLVNYKLAFVASIYVLFLIMLSDYKRSDEKKYEYLKQKAVLEFPDTNEGHDSYVMGRIKTLALNDVYGYDFDRLSYADMIFWIENYNKELIDDEILQRA